MAADADPGPDPAGDAGGPLSHTIRLRVRYTEVDAMGYLHHSRFLQYFEIGRVELLRERGVRYADLERDGIFFVVVRAEVAFKRPARYDDLIRIRTWIEELGGAHVSFQHEIVDAETGTLLARGRTKHPFVNKDWKPVRVPPALKAAFQPK